MLGFSFFLQREIAWPPNLADWFNSGSKAIKAFEMASWTQTCPAWSTFIDMHLKALCKINQATSCLTLLCFFGLLERFEIILGQCKVLTTHINPFFVRTNVHVVDKVSFKFHEVNSYCFQLWFRGRYWRFRRRSQFFWGPQYLTDFPVFGFWLALVLQCGSQNGLALVWRLSRQNRLCSFEDWSFCCVSNSPSPFDSLWLTPPQKNLRSSTILNCFLIGISS